MLFYAVGKNFEECHHATNCHPLRKNETFFMDSKMNAKLSEVILLIKIMSAYLDEIHVYVYLLLFWNMCTLILRNSYLF
jgi:hypothetical protein